MAANQASQQSRQFNNGYNLPNGTPSSGPIPQNANAPAAPQGRVVQAGGSRILCIADVRGNLRSLNDLARAAQADFIIHTGDFGFYDERSLDRIAEKTLKHVIQYSPLVHENLRREVLTAPPTISIKDRISAEALSQFPALLKNQFSLEVPVYTVWGACEDVQILEKLRSGEYQIDNLHIIDEAHSTVLEAGGVKLRLLGLGGAVVMHKLFDNGEGKTTIAGGQGTMWTTLLQMGELVETANQTFDPTETRVLVTHASPAREGLLNQLCVALKIDFSISAGLHFRYGSSYNEFSVNPSLDHYRGKLAASRASFQDVWETVRSEVEPAVEENETQKKLLHNALDIVYRMPSVANGGNPFGGQVGPHAGMVDETAFKNLWNFNLADAAFGWLVLELENGRIGTEMKAQGFNFAHRGMKNPALADMTKSSAPSPGVGAPMTTNLPSAPQQPPPQAQAGPTASAPPTQPRQGGPGAPMPPFSGSQQPRYPQQSRPQPQQQSSSVAPQQSQPSQSSFQNPQAQQGQRFQQPQQTQTPKPATPAASTRPAPAPSAPSTGSATNNAVPPPQTSATPAAGTTAPPATTSTPNGVQKEDGNGSKNKTNPPTGPSAEPAQNRDVPPRYEDKPTDGIFIQNVSGEEEAKNLFAEEHRAKIQRFERRGMAYIAHFSSIEEASAMLAAAPEQYKGRGASNKPNMRPALDRPNNRGGAGWAKPPRGGHSQSGNSGAPQNSSTPDGESGRGGRGGSMRGRGRGGDRGRGDRGGRGGFSRGGQGEGGASTSAAPASAPAAPAASS